MVNVRKLCFRSYLIRWFHLSDLTSYKLRIYLIGMVVLHTLELRDSCDDISMVLGKSQSLREENRKEPVNEKETMTMRSEPINEKETMTMRSEPMILSKKEVKTMLIEKDFFDKEWYAGGTGFSNDFKIQEDGKVVFDYASGLMWQQSGSYTKYKNFEEVNTYIRQLNSKSFAGYSNWRIPTLEEAITLMEPDRNSGGLYIDSKFDKKTEMDFDL